MPAGLYTISQWYKNTELSRRFAAFIAGYIFGQAVNGLLAYGMSVSRYTLNIFFLLIFGLAYTCAASGA